MGAEIEYDRERAIDAPQALEEILRYPLEQKCMSARIRRRPIAPPGEQAAIEDVVNGCHALKPSSPTQSVQYEDRIGRPMSQVVSSLKCEKGKRQGGHGSIGFGDHQRGALLAL